MAPVPVEVGGGLRDLQAVETALETGAQLGGDRDARGARPRVPARRAAAAIAGRIIVAVDARGERVAVKGWTEVVDDTVVEVGTRARDAGAAALLYTDVSRDGTETGPNVEDTAALAREVEMPILASGGVGRVEDLGRLAAIPGVVGTVVGRALYTGAIDLRRAQAVAAVGIGPSAAAGVLSMLAKRVIPCLDVKDGRVVKGVRFVDLRDAGDPVEAALAYDAQGADELVFLDITASHEARDIMLDVVRRTAEGIYMPLTVGGGIRSVDDVRRSSAPAPTRSR